jgi:hypothetical protein
MVRLVLVTRDCALGTFKGGIHPLILGLKRKAQGVVVQVDVPGVVWVANLLMHMGRMLREVDSMDLF